MEVKSLLKSKNEQLQRELFRLLALYAGQKMLLKTRKRPPEWWRLVSGGTLLYIGATGKIPFLSVIRRANVNHGQVNFKKQILIQRTREEVYAFFREFRNLKLILPQIEAINPIDIGKKHWEVHIRSRKEKYRTEIIVVKEKHNEFLGWSTGKDAFIYHTGRIELRKGTVEGITVLNFVFSYTPPGGKLGSKLFRMFNSILERHIDRALYKVHKIIEEER